MGSPDFSIPSLKMLIDKNHKPICVYTQSPQKKMRGQKVLKTPVHIYSEKMDIEVRTRKLDFENEYVNFKNLISKLFRKKKENNEQVDWLDLVTKNNDLEKFFTH